MNQQNGDDDGMENDDKIHKCHVCQKEFSSLTNLKRHETILHLKKHWSFKFKDSKQNDLLLPENETMKCNLCPQNFSSASEKIQHIFEVHEYFKDFPPPPNPNKNAKKDSKKDAKKVDFNLESNLTHNVTAAEEETRRSINFETLVLKSKRKSVIPKKMVDFVDVPVTAFFRRKPKKSPIMPLSSPMDDVQLTV